MGVSASGEALERADTSPFVIVAKNAGLHGFDHFINFIILVAVLSIAVSSVYGGSRTVTALAQQGSAPVLFTYVDRAGRQLPSVILQILFGFLGFICLKSGTDVVFDWLLALVSLAALFSWGSICLCHIRFRKAWLRQGHTLKEIPFKAIGGVYGSMLGLLLIAVVLAAQVRDHCFLVLGQ